MTIHYLTIEPRDWREYALCAQVGPDLFFPEQGQPVGEAKRVCAGCPVVDDCLEFHLALSSNADQFGIAGGLSQRERRELRRAARPDAA